MSHMHPRSTRPAPAARPAPASEVTQCRGLPAADAGQRQTAQRARQARPGGGAPLSPGLQAGIEHLSGLPMDDVRVHRDSAQPERIGALAFAEGRDIHLAPGQERHLPHEAWHVVQQAQGRVAATRQHAGGTAVNDDPALEREADAMGQAALGGGGQSGRQGFALPARIGNLPRVAQCVGGTKVSLRIEDSVTDAEPLLPTLIGIFKTYRQEIRDTKGQAKDAFKGHEDDIGQQTVFATALRAAEMDAGVLKQRIVGTGLFEVDGDGAIRAKAAPEVKSGPAPRLARIVKGNAAYAKSASKAKAVVHDVYRKFDPTAKTGLKAGSEYIQVDGRMLRRHAYRGITPLEIGQIERGGLVKPLFSKESQRAQSQSGMHFTGGFGKKRKRIKEKLDLSYLQTFSRVTSVSPAMYGFVHGRKGVGKFFSLRSTPGDITSNHGASFSSFGEIKLDLAQVKASDFVFHYADGGGDALTSGVPDKDIEDRKRHDDEVKRARESVVRNREIILKAYPAAAVSWVRPHGIRPEDIERQGFQDGFDDGRWPDFVLYETSYHLGRKAGAAAREAWFLGKAHGVEDRQAGLPASPEPDRLTDVNYMNGYRAGYGG
ncbi:DUF4157 domain-containing protein [Ideonella sp. DXS22W]|uniref:DUF4157 domain-containing protein n=1 Tax=Pseudaquabacterium inlustre TaxID=2984192 RepID=A0ABU9CGS6_9BURK